MADSRGVELLQERAALAKAEAHIAAGRMRCEKQRETLDRLRAEGHDVKEAERLATLMFASLGQWERHRTLIQERIAYLLARRN